MKTVRCNDCGHEWETKVKDYDRIKCPKCGSNKSLSVEEDA